MLVLTRKLGEKIQIGDDIVISILEIKGRQVRLGIVAPPNISVHREEIYQRIQEENIRAAKVNLSEFDKIKKLFLKKTK